MMCPPWLLRVRIQSPQRRFRLWLPLFLIWPLVALLVLASSPLIAVLAMVMWRRGRGKALLLAIPALFRVFCNLRGLRVEIQNTTERVSIAIR